MSLIKPFICGMFQIYFDYEEKTSEYIYVETSVEYRMSLLLMLKFKKYLREQSSFAGYQPIKQWFQTLSNDELKEINASPVS